MLINLRQRVKKALVVLWLVPIAIMSVDAVGVDVSS